MRSNLSAAALLLILAVCFTLGLISALVDRPGQPEPSPPPTDGPSAAPQTAVLVVGVDDLQSERPVLLALWIVTYRLPATNLYLLGVPVDFPVSSNGSTSLSDLCRFSPSLGVSSDFLQAVAEIVPVTPRLVVTLDRTAFIAFIDYLGGLELNGAHLDGIEVVAALDILGGDSQALLTAQARVLEAMTLRASLLGDSPDITPLLNLVPAHAHLSDSVGFTIGLAAPFLPIDPARVHFDTLGAHLRSPASP